MGQLKYTTWGTASATSDAILSPWNVLASLLFSLQILLFFLQGLTGVLTIQPAQGAPGLSACLTQKSIWIKLLSPGRSWGL